MYFQNKKVKSKDTDVKLIFENFKHRVNWKSQTVKQETTKHTNHFDQDGK